MFAEIAFPISNFKTFTYEIPDDLNSSVQVGSRVIAPFGKRKVQGIIVNVLKEKIDLSIIGKVTGNKKPEIYFYKNNKQINLTSESFDHFGK